MEENKIAVEFALRSIDAVLEFFASYEYTTAEGKRIITTDVRPEIPFMVLRAKYDYCGTLGFEYDYKLILEKLIKDGYVTFKYKDELKEDWNKLYIITFEGKIFWLQGGYGGIIKRNGLLEKNQKELQINQTALGAEQTRIQESLRTWTKGLVVVGAIALFLSLIALVWDVLKYFLSC